MRFLQHFLYKLSSLTISLVFICSCSFFLVRALPGSPFDTERALAPAIMASMNAKYGLDKPLFDQYYAYMRGVTQGTLGPSLTYPNRNVEDVLLDALPVSVLLGSIAISIAIILGLSFGMLAALYPNRLIGKIPSTLATLFMSTPNFVFAAVLIAIFGLQLNYLPVALWEGPEYMILPSISLAVMPTAYITRITRSAMLDTLSKEHILIALAKGLSYQEVILKHGLRNSLVPILTVVGPLIAMLITGSFVIEYIFALPGMGKYFVTAFINRDYFLVSGVVMIFASILLVINTITDLSLPLLDPKLRH